MTYFYKNCIDISQILELLGELGESERQEFGRLTESMVHHVVVDVVLINLSAKDQKVFLRNLTKDDHDKTWSHLSKKIDHLEDKIMVAFLELKASLQQDL